MPYNFPRQTTTKKTRLSDFRFQVHIFSAQHCPNRSRPLKRKELVRLWSSNTIYYIVGTICFVIDLVDCSMHTIRFVLDLHLEDDQILAKTLIAYNS